MINENQFNVAKNITYSLFLLIFFLVSIQSTKVTAAPLSSPLGINTNEIMENDASVPFVDLMKMAMPFEEARPWLTKGTVKYDKNGWPTYIAKGSQAGTRFLNDLPAGTIPNGHYTVLYQGEGILEYNHDARLVHRSHGRDVIAINAGKDKILRAILKIHATDPNNPLRNIRILLPGGICANNQFKRVNTAKQCHNSQFISFEKKHAEIIFNPEYLNYMKDFKVIRFMNMSGITRSPISQWSKRNTINKQTWSGKSGVRGAPVEIMVALANKLEADPWFNIPHKANDNYVRQFASVVKKQLEPNLKAYIEYTNEAWNGIFTQTEYVKQQGLRLKLDKNKHKAGYKYYSMRSVQIFKIWESAFGSTDNLIRVMGAWTPYERLTDMLLSHKSAYKKTDVLAIAPYFYPKLSSARKARTTKDIFTSLYDEKEPNSIPNVINLIKAQAKKAKQYGVQLVAYEGGQHLVDWDNRNTKLNPTKLFIQANKSQGMEKAHTDLLKGWKKAGGTLFVNFSAPRTSAWYGSWGTKEYLTQPLKHAPKHRSILSFIRQSPCWWESCSNGYIARLKKPIKNPGEKAFDFVSRTAVASNSIQARSIKAKHAELKRQKLASKRIETARRQDVQRHAAALKRKKIIHARSLARAKSFKIARRQRIIKRNRLVRIQRATRRPARRQAQRRYVKR